MPMPDGEEGACPKARPAQASVTPKAVFQFAENMDPTPLRDSVPKTPYVWLLILFYRSRQTYA